MLALGVRSVFLVITVASNSPMGMKEKLIPLDDPDVVDAVTGCATWGISLLAWITDSLFQLLDDPELMAILGELKRFSDLAKYLESKNYVALQLLLCSSTRGFLSALCRRLQHVETVSNRAAQYYETRVQQQQQDPAAATSASGRPHPALSRAYQRMERAVSSALVKVPEFDRLLSELGSDIQAAYHTSLSPLVASKVKPQAANSNWTEQQKQQVNDQFIKKAQSHIELDMLVGQNPPSSFREVLLKLFTTTLPAFRNQTDPAKLYFANYDLLGVEDSPSTLAMRKAAGKYVDVFKRAELVVGSRAKQTSSIMPAKGVVANGEETRSAAGNGSGEDSGMASYRTAIFGTWTGIGDGNGRQWRRCVRCASVVGDIWTGKPGYHFVLSQQRKCVCGGSWGTVPRGA
jgi:mediator of RNA polymerase II transcription subunit 16